SIGYGISADGLTIIGYGYSTSTHEAFRWTSGTGMVGLGFLPCDTWTIGRAASGNGSIIVGDPQTIANKCVFIWDAQHGLRELLNVLINDYGLNLAGWQLGRATALSYDGNIIVGYGTNPSGQTEAWIANITPTPPLLSVRRDGNDVVLSWPTNASGFVLQSTTNLTPLVNWIDSTDTPTIVGTELTVTNAVSENSRFYRLNK
ncbi:MAG: hypothetical protein JWM68_3286, partial [Verrucomicrobiales bacterium]|nr:hypothetical protein [Verrucomicrobiales bacterium]